MATLVLFPYFQYYGIMETEQILQAFTALSQEQRLRVFRALVQAGPQGHTPGQLSEALEMAPATLSFHLKELWRADLIDKQPQGRRIIYRARYQQIQAVIDYLMENCCGGPTCTTEQKP